MLLARLPLISSSIATKRNPFDLHVLGVLLAFILSQDQTLHKKSWLTLFAMLLTVNVHVVGLTYQRWHQSTFPGPLIPVSLTRWGLTSVFGMGTGVSPDYIDTTIGR